MLAKVLTLSLLAVAAVLAVVEDRSSEHDLIADIVDLPNPVVPKTKTVEARLLDGVQLRRGPSYQVPAGQCQVTLTPNELCGRGLVVASIEVSVLNPGNRFAEILFEMRDRHQVRVMLKECPRPWTVDLRLACLRQKPSRSHSRVPWVSRYI